MNVFRWCVVRGLGKPPANCCTPNAYSPKERKQSYQLFDLFGGCCCAASCPVCPLWAVDTDKVIKVA